MRDTPKIGRKKSMEGNLRIEGLSDGDRFLLETNRENLEQLIENYLMAAHLIKENPAYELSVIVMRYFFKYVPRET